ncbi:MAG: glycosyltransferase [Thiohalocapsa sp.]
MSEAPAISPPPLAAGGVPAGAFARTLLVYRHRLAPASEVGFLRRFYLGFEQLRPVWLGCHLEDGAAALSRETLRLGRTGPWGAVERTLFRHCGVLPPRPDLRALRPVLLHAHFGRGGALALPIARALEIPLVVTYHGADASKERHYRRHLLPPVYQRRLTALQEEAALFVCVSEAVRERLLARGFPAEKLAVIHQGIELDMGVAPSPPAWPEPYVLFVGRFTEKKGVSDLIAAMRLLQRQGGEVGLVLIGDGPLGGRLRHEAKDLRHVVFAGWRSSAEVRLAMRHAAAVCVPSVTAPDGDAEGLPSVVLEAMAAAAAVVATGHAGIGEAIEHGENGLLVPEGDPPALMTALGHVIGQPALRGRLGAAARATADEKFNALRQSRLLEAALLRAAGKAKS